jgi:type IV pilus assembly protein PilW
MTTREDARGFTLIELLVAMLVGAIVVGGAVLLMVNQQRAFTSGADDRALQEAGRLALEDMATNLRSAGYGVDPAMAFDFGAMANAPMDRAPPGTPVRVTGYACTDPVVCRDSATGPDELVFLARDPAFNHLVTAPPTTSEVLIQGPLRVPLHRGQILQLACFSGSLDWAYVTVGADVAVTATSPVPVPLATATGSDFPLQNDWLTRTCFQSGLVTALKVDRYRYFVATYDPAGGVQPWGTPGARPFLMLDQGLTTGNAQAPILTMVAPDVEDLQVTYLFPLARAPATTLAPGTVGAPLSNGAGGVDLAPTAGVPAYATARTAASRFTNHPANIRGVRVAVTIRSAEKRVDEGSTADNLIPAAGNRAAVAAPEIGYRHLMFEATTVPLNLDARTPYIPALSTSGGTDNLNVGGG